MKYFVYLITGDTMSKTDLESTNRKELGLALETEYGWIVGRDVMIVPAKEATGPVMKTQGFFSPFHAKYEHDRYFCKDTKPVEFGGWLVNIRWRDCPQNPGFYVYCKGIDSGNKYFYTKNIA